MLWLFVGRTWVYLLDFFCSGIQFYLLLSPYLCFISFSRGASVQNVKNKHLGMPPFLQNFHLFYRLVHSIGSLKPDVTVCLIRYPSFS